MIFNKKITAIFLTVVVVASLALAVFLYCFNPQKQLELNFLDVGQGDAALIKTPYGQNIIIDGGDGKKILPELPRVLPFYDRTIDLMILTHPHDDHVGGLVKVLQRYRVQKILYTGVVHTSPMYLEWLAAVQRKNIPLVIIDRPQEIILGPDLKMEILWPRESLLGKEVLPAQAGDNLNNSSIVVQLVYKEKKFLFVGDAEVAVEAELLHAGVPLASDVLKVGHHGSDNASSEEFLNKIKPAVAVISVGKDNDFGHPSLRTTKKLERLGAKIYRTDLNGWIKIISDGKMVDIKTAK